MFHVCNLSLGQRIVSFTVDKGVCACMCVCMHVCRACVCVWHAGFNFVTTIVFEVSQNIIQKLHQINCGVWGWGRRGLVAIAIICKSLTSDRSYYHKVVLRGVGLACPLPNTVAIIPGDVVTTPTCIPILA